MTKPKRIASGQVLQAGVGDLAVRNTQYGAIQRAYAGRAQPDFVYTADGAAHLDSITQANGLVKDQREPAYHVLESLLCG